MSYEQKIKLIKFGVLFVIMLIILKITNTMYYQKLDSMSNDTEVYIDYNLDEDGYEKLKE